MAGRLLTGLRRVNATRRPEHDLRLRLLTLVAVAAGVVAVGTTGAAPWPDVVVALALLPVGSWWSWRRRESSNYAAKAVVSVAALAALARFFGDLLLSGSLDDARQPLAQLFLAVQVLHAFDLPQRRDLTFTLGSSLALMALAGAAARDLAFAPLLAGYLAVAGLALARLERSAAAERAEGAGGGLAALPTPRTPGRRRLVPVLATAMTAAVLFGLLPVPSSGALGGLPFSPGRGSGTATGARVSDGSLPFGDGDGTQEFDPLEYFGFAERVDPRTVGQLSDAPVLRVRTPRPRLLRGVVFDRYEGGVWQRSGDEPQPSTGLPVPVQPPSRPLADTDRMVQTVELLRDTPNLLFGAADVTEVWTAGRSVSVWDDGTLTTSATQSAGTVYSVVSLVEMTPRDELRRLPGRWERVDPGAYARWTALPDDVSPRVLDLAAQLAVGVPDTPYARAEAVQRWIGEHVSYSLGAPPPPPGRDAAEHLLFSTRQGWCEPIATAMVVLLRAQGVPARFVTGFQPGDRDLLTGWWTVRAHHAHAWVEVFVPQHGWVAFDPTGAVPFAVQPDAGGLTVPLLAALARLREALPPGAVPALVAGLAALAAVTAGAVAARRRLVLRRAGPWARLEAMLSRRGLRPDPAATPAERVSRAQVLALDAEALAVLRAHEEARRYGAPAPSGDDVRRALESLGA